MNRPKPSTDLTPEPLTLQEIPEASNSSSGIRTIAELTSAAYKIIVPPEPKIQFLPNSIVEDWGNEHLREQKAKYRVAVLQEVVQKYLHPARRLTYQRSIEGAKDPEDFMDGAFEFFGEFFYQDPSQLQFEINELNALQKIILIGDWRTRDGIAQLFEKLKSILAPEYTIIHADGSKQTISSIKIFNPDKL